MYIPHSNTCIKNKKINNHRNREAAEEKNKCSKKLYIYFIK